MRGFVRALTRPFGVGTLVSITAALLAAPAFAQSPAALRLTVAVGPVLPLGKSAERWAERLREGSEAIAVKLHPGASLAERDAARELLALKEGRADLGVGSSLQWAMQLPALGVFSLPWIAPDDAQLLVLTNDGPLRELIAARLASAGVHLVALAPLGYREIATASRPIRAPGDLSGLRLRATASPLLQDVLRALGAMPQSMPFAEAQAAFAQGSLDGQEGPPTALAAARAPASSQRHVTDLGGIAEVMVFAVRAPVWDALTPAQQEHVRRAAELAIVDTRALEREQAALRQLAAQGAALLRLTSAGQQAFRAASREAADRWRGTIGEEVVAAAERAVGAAPVPQAVPGTRSSP